MTRNPAQDPEATPLFALTLTEEGPAWHPASTKKPRLSAHASHLLASMCAVGLVKRDSSGFACDWAAWYEIAATAGYEGAALSLGIPPPAGRRASAGTSGVFYYV